MCRVVLRLLLGVLSWIVLLNPTTAAEHRPPPRTRPYLVALGASPLRIQAALPPADLSVRPPAGAPPVPTTQTPTGSPAETSPPVQGTPPAESAPADLALAPTSANPSPEEKPDKAHKPILPDDTRPKVRAEDFLPFFQPPGANPNPNDVTVAPPPAEPGSPTPSTATYRQQ